MIRRRPLLRAVAIGGGAYLDCIVRIESTRFLESVRESGSARTGVGEVEPARIAGAVSPLTGDARTDRVRLNVAYAPSGQEGSI